MADSIDRHIAYWSKQVPDLDVHVEGAVTRMQGLVRLLWRRREAGLAARELKGWEYDILWRIRSAGPPFQVSPTWLAKALDTHPATLTSRLERLEGTGHLTRVHDPADRRRLLVELTDLGHRMWEATIEDQAANERALLAVLTEVEREQLSDLLRKVVTAAEEHEAPLMPPVENAP
ncbi:MarR family winged helix-turn-helix transcriptional regulator [Actinosynnema sp. ALI-1.44]|uniref:MarR family winged helix-turn-helix transcriptional regulator n=1 Tax=Actinosynnema sp. ALI-1.44 TaxID=1933779 RepID=UPI00192D0A19|nr:MarR family transcriptional regulator [Actinosynnema sp. ALI-1.44]